jgi:hypothetical protein
MEFSSDGEIVWSRSFGAHDNVLDVSDFAVREDGVLIVTGEFSGPPLLAGSVLLCEAEPGSPPAELRVPIEPGPATDPCRCRRDQRDLYLMALTDAGQPLWGRVLGVGHSEPLVALGKDGEVFWLARKWRTGAEALPVLWRIDRNGAVRARFTAGGAASGSIPRAFSTTSDGGFYVADDAFVRRGRPAVVH